MMMEKLHNIDPVFWDRIGDRLKTRIEYFMQGCFEDQRAFTCWTDIREGFQAISEAAYNDKSLSSGEAVFFIKEFVVPLFVQISSEYES